MAKLLQAALGQIYGFAEQTRKERFALQSKKRELLRKGERIKNKDESKTRFVNGLKEGQLVPVFTLKPSKTRRL